MRTKLYKDISTERIYTFAELKSDYEIAVNAEIEIDNDTMTQIIHENLWSCGGNIQVISDNDEVLRWCNDYAERMEADRVMTADEISDSIRDLYLAIENNDSDLIQGTIDNLYFDEDEEDTQLYKRLIVFFEDKGEK